MTPQLLQDGGVTVVCSALYRPFSEMDLDEPFGAPPESAYYEKLVELMDATEREVEAAGHVDGAVGGRPRARATRARSRSSTASRAASTSAPSPTRSPRTSASWRERGVLYITLAHLFWRQVATNAPALPFLPDAVYNRLFPQRACRA